MQIDRKMLDSLLSLNDRQLQSLFVRLINESGIDPSQFNINPQSVQSIRNAIRGATDEDLTKIAEQYEANKKGGRR